MLSRLQHYVEGFFARSSSAFHAVGFSPNSITVLGFLSIAGVSVLYGLSLSSLALWGSTVLLLIVAGFLDAVDGAMARRYHHVSKAGGVLDSVLDRLGEIFLYSGLALGGLTSFPVALWALSASLMVSYIRARVEVEGFTLKGIGVAERPERLLVVLVATLVFPFWNSGLYWGSLLVAVLASVTVVERVYGSWKVLGARALSGAESRTVSLLGT